MKNCLDCKYCIISRPKGTLRCKAQQWKMEVGNEKVVKLRDKELKSDHIEHRIIFLQAEQCPLMISML